MSSLPAFHGLAFGSLAPLDVVQPLRFRFLKLLQSTLLPIANHHSNYELET